MVEITTPKSGYGFKHLITGEPSLVLYLGTGDGIWNYQEVSEEEYNRLVAEQEKASEEQI